MRVLGLFAVAAAALAVVQIVSTDVQAQVEVNTDEGGTIVRIGPDRAEGRRDRRQQRRQLNQPGFVDPAPVPVSRYWIGVGGGPLPPELRAQVDSRDGEGVLIRTVAEGGPAAEAGIRPFDIVLRANGKLVNTMADLADHVGEQGERKGRITLDLLRRGKPKTLWVKPVERPVDAIAETPRPRGRFGLFGPNGRFGGGGQGLEGLDLEGLFNGGAGGFGEMLPGVADGGVSVQVFKQDDAPAKVVVRRGGQTWEFDEGDDEAFAALPEDMRPTVQRMLSQNGRLTGEGLDAFRLDAPGFQLQLDGEMAERIRAIQERMRGQVGARANDPALGPQIELDEAPAFDAEPTPTPAEEVEEVEPIEVEIPAEG